MSEREAHASLSHVTRRPLLITLGAVALFVALGATFCGVFGARLRQVSARSRRPADIAPGCGASGNDAAGNQFVEGGDGANRFAPSPRVDVYARHQRIEVVAIAELNT